MASQKYILTEIKKGYNLSWYVCSQCYYTGTIKLYDDTGKVYFTCSKTSGGTSYQSLAQGHVDFTGNELYLSVEIPQSTEIRQSITANSVTDAHAVKVGQVYGHRRGLQRLLYRRGGLGQKRINLIQPSKSAG